MKKSQQFLCMILCLSMLAGNLPVLVHAEDLSQQGLCPHHPEHSGCSYAPATESIPCTHQHTQDCYQTVTNCVHVHGDCGFVEETAEVPCLCPTAEDGTIAHQENCGYIPAKDGHPCSHTCDVASGCIKEVLKCPHQHDEQCGYVEATEAVPCDFACQECVAATESSKPDCIGTLDCSAELHSDTCEKLLADLATANKAAADEVSALLNALPALDSIPNQAAAQKNLIREQVQVVQQAYFSLSPEQKSLLPDVEKLIQSYLLALQEEETATTESIGGTFAGDFTWKVDGTKLIIGGNGTIPAFGWQETIPWQDYQNDITSCTFQEGIQCIDNPLLADLPNLQQIYVPLSLTSVGNNVFPNNDFIQIFYPGAMRSWSKVCEVSKNITCQDGVIQISGKEPYSPSNASWFWCENGTLYVDGDVHSSLTENLGSDALNVTEIYFYEGTTTFLHGPYEFGNVREITIPPTMRSATIAHDTRSLQKIHISDLAAWCSFDNHKLFYGGGGQTQAGLYLNGELITDLVIPEGVTEIRSGPFSSYVHLKSVTFPESLGYLSNYAFGECYNLREIRFTGNPCLAPNTPNVFYQVVANVYYPAGKGWDEYYHSYIGNYGGTLNWKEYGKDVQLLEFSNSEDESLLVGETQTIRVQGTPKDAVVDCTFSLSSGNIVEIVQSDRKTVTLKGVNPGTVTLTAYEKQSGKSFSTQIHVANYKAISCPYEESIPIESSYVSRVYTFTPPESGNYILKVKDLPQSLYFGYVSVDGIYEYSYLSEEDLEWSCIPLEKGKLYTIRLNFREVPIGKTGIFSLQKASANVESIALPDQLPPCNVGDKIYLRAALTPVDAVDDIVWESSSPEIFDISYANGTFCSVIGKAPGQATLTATCNGKQDTVTIQVEESLTIQLDETLTLSGQPDTEKRIRFTAEEAGRYAITVRGNREDRYLLYGGQYAPDSNPIWNNTNGRETLCLNLTAGQTHEFGVYFDFFGDMPREVTVTKAATKPSSMTLSLVDSHSGTLYIAATFQPESAAEKVAEWKISDPSLLAYSNYKNDRGIKRFKVCGKGEVTVTAVSESGLEASYTLSVASCINGHNYQTTVLPATCTDGGYTTHICADCGKGYLDTRTAPLGHQLGAWTLTKEPTPDTEGEECRKCERCDYSESRPLPYSGNILKLDGPLAKQKTVWIDGAPYPVTIDSDGNALVELPQNASPYLVTYSYHSGSGGDRHTQYPVGMQVYEIQATGTGATTHHLPDLDNLLRYSGSSIRIVGNKGIRMITSIDRGTRNALTSSGLSGFTLEEYGTVLCRANQLGNGALTLDNPNAKSNFAYKKGVADPVYKYTGNLIQYTNVLVGFSNDDCKDDIAMRPYIKLRSENGEIVTLYGGIIYRSIGYIACQNRNAFAPESAAYQYVWDIIHHVYGSQYDREYKK